MLYLSVNCSAYIINLNFPALYIGLRNLSAPIPFTAIVTFGYDNASETNRYISLFGVRAVYLATALMGVDVDKQTSAAVVRELRWMFDDTTAKEVYQKWLLRA